METLLVLAVLVLIGALVYPRLDRPFDNVRLRKSADQVRTDWTRARNRAMISGEIQVFRYLAEGERYQVGPYEGIESEVEAATVAESESAPAPLVREHRLPEGVLFAVGETAVDPRAAQLEFGETSLDDKSRQAGLSWSAPILFYPDGTTSSVLLTLVGRQQRALAVELRGLTGLARVGEPYDVSSLVRQ